ncbi:MAG: hypothetical protein ACI8PB_004962 [Desulforhopalus sp.]|jgi:hypothetical protein
MMLPKSLTPCFFPVLVPEKCHVISNSNEDILSFRALGTLFSGAHVCAKKDHINKKIRICGRTAFVCPCVPILLYIYNLYKVSICYCLVCGNEKSGSQAGKKRGVRDSGQKMEVFA